MAKKSEEWGKELKRLRDKRGWTQKQLLQQLYTVSDRYANYEDPWVSKLEHGTLSPNSDLIIDLTKVFDDLLSEVEKVNFIFRAGWAPDKKDQEKILQLLKQGWGPKVEEDVKHLMQMTKAEHSQQLEVLGKLPQRVSQQLGVAESLQVLTKWKEQSRYLSLCELLCEYGLKDLHTYMRRHSVETEEISTIYRSTKKVHCKTTSLTPGRVMVELEAKDPLFRRLRKQFPVEPVWKSYDSWGHEFAVYLDTFTSWFDNLKEVIETMFKSFVEEKPADIDFANSFFSLVKKVVGGPDEAADFELGMHLTCLIVGCFILALGLRDLSPNLRWFSETSQLEKLETSLILEGKKLVNSYPFESTNYARLAELFFNDHEDRAKARAKTMDLLKRLENLQRVQDELHSQITSFQDRFLGGE